jgi:glutamate-1-semialdehyde 2,1-aminomutase
LNAPYPFTVAGFNDVSGTRALIESAGDRLAALIVEPMLGGAGAIPGSPEFLHVLREVTEKTGAMLIFDEVMTSRLAPGGIQGVHGIRPDLTTFGKYLGGGFSFGAFGGPRHLMERFDPSRPDALSHPGTFNNNTITMAAGAAGLREVFTAEAVRALNERGDDLRDQVNTVFSETGVAMQATGIGSILGLHFQRNPITSPTDIIPATAQRTLIHLAMMLRGHYFARRGYLALSVALTDEDIDHFVVAMRETVTEYAAVLG